MIYLNMRTFLRSFAILLAAGCAVAVFSMHNAEGFASKMAGDVDCSKCHQLTIDEANTIIRGVNPEISVMGVAMSPVEGMWEVVIEKDRKKGIAYIDFSKNHIMTGSILQVSDKENLTNRRLYELSKVDISTIPLDEALYMGKRDAKYKVIVFADPD